MKHLAAFLRSPVAGVAMVWVGFVFLHLETMYFLWRDGLHLVAETPEEHFCDLVSIVCVFYGLHLLRK